MKGNYVHKNSFVNVIVDLSDLKNRLEYVYDVRSDLKLPRKQNLVMAILNNVRS